MIIKLKGRCFRRTLFALFVILGCLGFSGYKVTAHFRTLQKQDKVSKSVTVAKKTSLTQTETQNTKVASSHKLSEEKVVEKRKKILKNLNAYLAKVGKSDLVSVNFYNLAPTAKSDAAEANDSAVYDSGMLRATINGNQEMWAASTYKLYISAYLFNQVAIGEKSWTADDDYQFKEMIVNSENDYVDEQLSLYGRPQINEYLNKIGVADVFSEGISVTNANDLMGILKRIEKAQAPFNQSKYRKMLLNYMAIQVYRDGIPAGAEAAMTGTKAQDKVGWYGSYNNDAAIVSLPNGQRYLLVIMTNGNGYYNFSQVEEITKKIQTIVYNP